MSTQLLKFELHLYLKQPFIQFSLLLFFLAGLTIYDRVGYNASEFADSQYMLSQVISFVNLILPIFLLMFSSFVQMRDKSYQVTEMLFVTGSSSSKLLLHRFAGLALTGLVIIFTFSTAMWLRSVFPIFLEANIVAQSLLNYWCITVFFSIPTVLFFAAILTYSSWHLPQSLSLLSLGTLIYVSYFIISILFGSPLMGGNLPTDPMIRNLSAMIDPFAIISFFELTDSWSINSQNYEAISLTGSLLLNRVFWLIITAAILFAMARMQTPFLPTKLKKKPSKSANSEAEFTTKKYLNFSSFETIAPNIHTLKSLIKLIRFELSTLTQSIYFLGLLVIWGAVLLADLCQLSQGTGFTAGVYPTTANALDRFQHEFLPRFSLFVIVFYCAEIMWREQQYKVAQLVSALPVDKSMIIVSKLIALSIIPTLLTLSAVFVSFGYQLFNGSVPIELSVYIGVAYFSVIPLILKSAICIFIHLLSPSKYVGLVLSFLLLLLLGTNMNANLGLEHPLWRVADAPKVIFSDINNFSLANDAYSMFILYWSSIIGLCGLILIKLSQAELQLGLFRKLRHVIRNTTKVQSLSILLCLSIAVVSGSLIFYRTNVEANYLTKEQQLKWRIDYEKRFKQYQNLIQPALIKINTKVEIIPDKRIYEIKGTYTYKNKSSIEINKLIVYMEPHLSMSNLVLPNASLVDESKLHGTYVYQLADSLMPGEQLDLMFTVFEKQSGFKKTNHKNKVVKNGTFIFASDLLPKLGYLDNIEVTVNKYREKYKLIPYIDRKGLNEETVSVEFVDFETVITTKKNQIALAPGELVSEWKDDSNSYYHYKTTSPIRNNIAYLSGEYQLREEVINGVKIQLFYHEHHSYNLDLMMTAIKQSFEIFEKSYGPYPHNVFRQVETPNFTELTGYSLPTMTLMSETGGFTDVVDISLAYNDVYRRTIHEMSHQWWANQMAPNQNSVGGMLLVESFAKYSELIVMEKYLGKDAMLSLVDYEIARYFEGQSKERDQEKSLSEMENHQNYLTYSKGTFVMNSLRTIIGDVAIKRVLSNLINSYSFGRKSLTADSFLSAIYRLAPSKKATLHELFEQISFFITKSKSAKVKKRNDGDWELNLTLDIEKWQKNTADDAIKSNFIQNTSVTLIYADNKKTKTIPITLKSGVNQFKLIVNQSPDFIIIDPERTILAKDLHKKLLVE